MAKSKLQIEDGLEVEKKDVLNSEESNLSIVDNQTEEINLKLREFLKSDKRGIGQREINRKTIIPSGLDILDATIGGGIPTSLIQLVGNPGCGKSMLAAKFLSEGKKRFGNNFLSVYLDTENSITTERLSQLGITGCEIFNKNITVEKVLKCIQSLCSFKDSRKELKEIPSMIVWDSIANTSTEKGLETEDLNSAISERARVLSFNLSKACDLLGEYNITLIAVNQTRSVINIGPVRKQADLRFMSDKQVPGGSALQFNSIQLFELRSTTDIKDDYKFSGFRVELKSVKNKLFCSNIKVSLVYSFERGFSNFWSNYEFLKNYGRIDVGGGWVNMVGYARNKKFRQFETIKIYREDPEFKECFDSNLNELIKTEILDKYNSTDFSKIEP